MWLHEALILHMNQSLVTQEKSLQDKEWKTWKEKRIFIFFSSVSASYQSNFGMRKPFATVKERLAVFALNLIYIRSIAVPECSISDPPCYYQ